MYCVLSLSLRENALTIAKPLVVLAVYIHGCIGRIRNLFLKKVWTLYYCSRYDRPVGKRFILFGTGRQKIGFRAYWQES